MVIRKVFYLLILLILMSCDKNFSNKDKVYEEFELSFENIFKEKYSMKIKPNDTMFILYEKLPKELKNKLKIGHVYYSLLTKSEITEINAKLSAVKLDSLQTENVERNSNGVSFHFYFNESPNLKSIYIHELDKGPKGIDDLANYMLSLISNSENWHLFKNKVEFKSTIKSPPPPPELIDYNE